jgi:hypothetical protein
MQVTLSGMTFSVDLEDMLINGSTMGTTDDYCIVGIFE